MKKSGVSIAMEKVEQLIQIKQQQIDLLEELRRSLLAESEKKAVRKVKRVSPVTGEEIR
jgi:hypothetical protein